MCWYHQPSLHDVRHVVVGGVATVLRGYPRLTLDLDLDLAIDLDRAEQPSTRCCR